MTETTEQPMAEAETPQAAATEAPPKPAGPCKSPEEWARQKGHIFREMHTREPQKARITGVEKRSHALDGLCAHAGWVVGQMVTEQEFDDAQRAFLEEPIR